MVRVPRPRETGRPSSTCSVKIKIEGMRCQNCVNNIERTIGGRPEVTSVKVKLEEKAGYIEYKVNEITTRELLEAIQDMGFVASLCGDESSCNESELKNVPLEAAVSTCSIHVDGMTCMSCVKNITGYERILQRFCKVR